MIAAILRAQVLSMRLGRAGARGALFSVFSGVLWYGLWCFVAVSTYEVTAHGKANELELTLRAGLFVVFGYWQLIPVLSSSLGAGLDMRKLLLFPAPHGRLFRVEVLLRALGGAEMLLVIAGGAAGLASNPAAGGFAAVPRIALAASLFALCNVLLSSGLRSVLERLLARSRVREFAALLVVTGLMLPRFFAVTGSLPAWLEQMKQIPEDGMPWTAAAHAMTGHNALGNLFALCAWTALAAIFGRWQFEHSLRYDAIAAQASAPPAEGSRRRRWAERFYRFPALLWSDPLAAIVEKELRTLTRAPRFRMVFVMGFSFGLLVWLPLVVGRGAEAAGVLGHNFLVVVSVYAMTLMGQVSYWNSFGFDRSAAQIYFAVPQPADRAIAGKNLAAMVFIYLEALILVAVTLALRVPLRVGQVAEMFVVLTVCSVYMLALGNISSVHYPRALNPERVSQGGASSRFQILIFIFYPLALLPVCLAYMARYIVRSELVFWLLMTIAALIAGGLYWVATDSARITLVRRREYIVQELSRGEGPVSGT